MKILATFVILLTLCSITFNKKSMKSSVKEKSKSKTKSISKANKIAKKSDPGAILPAVAVINYLNF